jgi:phosphoserine phosphatase
MEEKLKMATKDTIKAVGFDFDGVLFDGFSWLELTSGLGVQFHQLVVQN